MSRKITFQDVYAGAMAVGIICSAALSPSIGECQFVGYAPTPWHQACITRWIEEHQPCHIPAGEPTVEANSDLAKVIINGHINQDDKECKVLDAPLGNSKANFRAKLVIRRADNKLGCETQGEGQTVEVSQPDFNGDGSPGPSKHISYGLNLEEGGIGSVVALTFDETFKVTKADVRGHHYISYEKKTEAKYHNSGLVHSGEFGAHKRVGERLMSFWPRNYAYSVINSYDSSLRLEPGKILGPPSQNINCTFEEAGPGARFNKSDKDRTICYLSLDYMVLHTGNTQGESHDFVLSYEGDGTEANNAKLVECKYTGRYSELTVKNESCYTLKPEVKQKVRDLIVVERHIGREWPRGGLNLEDISTPTVVFYYGDMTHGPTSEELTSGVADERDRVVIPAPQLEADLIAIFQGS